MLIQPVDPNRTYGLDIFKSIIIWTFITIVSIGLLFAIHVVETRGLDKSRIRAEFGINALMQHHGTVQALLHHATRPMNLLQAWWNSSPGPELYIDIKFKHIERLRKQRLTAMENGRLIQSEDSYVPASIRVGRKLVDVDIRLKGDHLDHLDSDRWSLRVKVNRGDHILGYRRFSLQHPKTRNFQGEVLFGTTLREVGVLAPDYRFVTVRVNGEKWGVMALEEHFSKELLERNRHREGVIIRFDESLFWARQSNHFQHARIDAFRESRIEKSEFLSSQKQIAIGLLRGFVEQTIPPSQVFDSEKIGAFLAVSSFFNAWHAVRWHNVRFYMNPITLLLEPIGYDSDITIRETMPIFAVEKEPMVRFLFDSPEIRESYMRHLRWLVARTESGDLVERLHKQESLALEKIHSEFILVEPFSRENLMKRAGAIREHLLSLDINRRWSGWQNRLTSALAKPSAERVVVTDNEEEPEEPKKKLVLLQAYLIEEFNKRYLELVNIRAETVNVTSIEVTDQASQYNSSQLIGKDDFIQVPASNRKTGFVGKTRILLVERFNLESQIIKIVAQLSSSPSEESIPVIAKPYHAPLFEHPLTALEPHALLTKFRFLKLDEKNRVFSVIPGNWRVPSMLILPQGYSLRIDAGTTLDFTADAGIVVHGPTQFHGTQTAPIQFIADRERGGIWKGIAVFNANQPSVWRYVTVSNVGPMNLGDWQLTGAVTFYRSDVSIVSSKFNSTVAEDALNIINSHFFIDNSIFSNAQSDGFDGDFVKGSIHRSRFHQIGYGGGGDAIDLSGSVAQISDCQFNDVQDKAVSAGERSNTEISGATFSNVNIGVVSKDLSKVTISDSNVISFVTAAAMVYSKKSEYGPASLIVESSSFGGDAKNIIVQTHSTAIVNGVQMESIPLDVGQLYQPRHTP